MEMNELNVMVAMAVVAMVVTVTRVNRGHYILLIDRLVGGVWGGSLAHIWCTALMVVSMLVTTWSMLVMMEMVVIMVMMMMVVMVMMTHGKKLGVDQRRGRDLAHTAINSSIYLLKRRR